MEQEENVDFVVILLLKVGKTFFAYFSRIFHIVHPLDKLLKLILIIGVSFVKRTALIAQLSIKTKVEIFMKRQSMLGDVFMDQQLTRSLLSLSVAPCVS